MGRLVGRGRALNDLQFGMWISPHRGGDSALSGGEGVLKQRLPVHIIEILGHGNEVEPGPVLADGIVDAAQFAGQPCLVLGNGLELRLAKKHHSKPVTARGLVHAHDVQLVHSFLEALPEFLGGADVRNLLAADVVDVQGAEAVGLGASLYAAVVLVGGLPADAGQQSLGLLHFSDAAAAAAFNETACVGRLCHSQKIGLGKPPRAALHAGYIVNCNHGCSGVRGFDGTESITWPAPILGGVLPANPLQRHGAAG